MSQIFCLILMFLLAGCASEKIFYAASDGKGGGVAAFTADSRRDFAAVPGVNYLIFGRSDRELYGTIYQYGSGGAVARFETDGRGGVKAGAVTPTPGAGACHLALSPDGRFLYTADYGSGSISELEVLPDGSLKGRGMIRHFGRGPDRARQQGPHVHFVGFTPDRKSLAAVDLGLDAVFFYRWTPEAGLGDGELLAKVKLHAGAGPRHLAFGANAKSFYTANELDGTVSSFVLQDGAWRHVRTIPTLFASSAAAAVRNYPGALKLSHDGSALYLTNRGSDTVAVIGLGENGAMTLNALLPAGGAYPSDLVETSGGTLVTANRKSHSVDRAGAKGGRLLELPNACSILQ